MCCSREQSADTSWGKQERDSNGPSPPACLPEHPELAYARLVLYDMIHLTVVDRPLGLRNRHNLLLVLTTRVVGHMPARSILLGFRSNRDVRAVRAIASRVCGMHELELTYSNRPGTGRYRDQLHCTHVGRVLFSFASRFTFVHTRTPASVMSLITSGEV